MDLPLSRPGTGGLKPLYKLYQWFLNDAVQVQTIGDYISDNEIQKWSDIDFLSNWQSWTGYFTGFIAAVLVGVFLLIGVPILGFCYCWCRSICRCKPQCLCCRDFNSLQPKPVKPPSKCKTRVCIGILLPLLITMFTMVVLSFVLSASVKNELSGESLMTQDLIQSIDDIEKYLKNSLNDIKDALYDPLNGTSEELVAFVDGWPSFVVEGLETESGFEPALSAVNIYIDQLPHLSDYLSIMQNLTVLLEDDISQLNQNFTNSRNTIGPLVDECIALTQEDICYTIKGKLDNLEARANFSTVEDMSHIISVINSEIDRNISDDVIQGINLWENVTMGIESSFSNLSDSFRGLISNLETEIDSVVQQVNATLSDVSVSQVTAAVEDFQAKYLDEYAPYYSAVVGTVTSLALLVVVLNILGLILGIFCGPRTAKYAANLLMSSIAFFLIFGWIFILITTLTFTAGGGLEVLACRHAVGYDDTMTIIETITKNEFELSYIISGKQLMEKCSEDKAIYTSLNLAENGFNVSQYLDLSDTGIYDSLDDIRSISIGIPYIDIFLPDLENRLHQLYSNTSLIAFETYTSELEKGLVSLDIGGLHSDLLEASRILKNLPSHNMSYISQQLEAEADVILELEKMVLFEVDKAWMDLREATDLAKHLASDPNITTALYNISEAEILLNSSTDTILQPLLNESIDSIIEMMNSYTALVIYSIENEVAPCRDLYISLQTLIYAPCVYLLYPFNAFWFCYGWYFTFGLVGIFVATSYVDILRLKSQKNKLYPTSVNTTTLSYIKEESFADNDEVKLLHVTPPTVLSLKPSIENAPQVVKESTGISMVSERTRVSIVSNRITPIVVNEPPVRNKSKHQSFLNYLDFVYGSQT